MKAGLGGGGLFALLATLACFGCVLDLAGKHACRDGRDCLGSNRCVLGTCRAPVDAAVSDAPKEAPDASDAPVSADAIEDRAPAATDAADGDAAADASADGDASAAADDGPRHVEFRARYVSSDTPNYVFVTSRRFPPKFPSLADADQKCDDAARAAGLPGTYRAWLSTSAVPARDRIADARGWIRPDGAPFADSMPDVVRGWIFYPPLIDENRVEVRGGAAEPVATGTSTNGLAGSACNDWTADGDAVTFPGFTESTAGGWTENNDLHIVRCDAPMHLYCFGIDHVATVGVLPEAGKKAFLSSGSFNAGVDFADDLCNQEAGAAGLSGTFLAMLSTTQMAAADRFPSTADHRWVRLDGVPLVDPGQDLFRDGPLVAPLNLTSHHQYLQASVWTGSRDPSSPAMTLVDTCDDWVFDGEGLIGVSGAASKIRYWLSSDEPAGCARNVGHVYCLEL